MYMKGNRLLTMPIVEVKLADSGYTVEQKQAVIVGITQVLVDTLGKNPATTRVLIQEYGTDNWGINGQTMKVFRENKPK